MKPNDPKPTAGADVVFCSEVTVAPPAACPFPETDASLRVVPKGDAADAPCPLYVDEEALRDAIRFGGTRRSVEVGGLLVGGHYTDGEREYVRVEDFLEARHLDSRATSARFTHATFEDAWRRIGGSGPRAHPRLVVGWFHTHPGFGAFLSQQDRFVHRRFFDLPFLVALVVDPVREEMLFFRWRDGEIKSTGFYLVRQAG